MSMKTIVSSAIRWALARDIDEITSEASISQRAMRVAKRYSRGNTNVQHGRVTTESDQTGRIAAYVARVKRRGFFFQK